MLSRADLDGGAWVAVNVWNGSAKSTVSVTIGDGEQLVGTRTQSGSGEAKLKGAEFADPLALAKQSTQSSVAAMSVDGGSDTAGFTTWQGSEWQGKPGPFQAWMLTDNSHHLWRVDLPSDLPAGAHTMEVSTTDRNGRTFSRVYAFEVVEELPNLDWQAELWQ